MKNLSIFLVLLLVVINGAWSIDPIVNTTLGLVRGLREHVNGVGDVDVFLSIPFAASTAGENRFLSPQKRESWGDSVLNCTQVGPGCVQGHHNADVPCGGKNMGPRCQSEDCLNLNVYVPDTADKAPATMIWLYGGAFEEGMNWGPVRSLPRSLSLFLSLSLSLKIKLKRKHR